MNTPNKLTVLRICIVPFVIAATLVEFPLHYLIGGLLFGAAAITDLFDGKIARRDNLVTDFGKFADPLADKILVISCLICFLKLGFSMAVPIIIILFREFTITSIRLVASAKGRVIAANMWGKVKTVAQIVAISVIYVMNAAYEIVGLCIGESWNIVGLPFMAVIIIISNIFIWISTIFTIVSGVKYVIDNKDIISDM